MKGIQDTSTHDFRTIINSSSKFIVPKFQRDYSWDKEQWADLWQDIETMRENNEDHYMGYLVLQVTQDKLFKIIDGQQRFTTISLLILSAIKCIDDLAKEGEETEANNKRSRVLKDNYIGKEDPVSLDYDNRLVLNRNNDAYYKDYIVKLDLAKVRNLKTTEKLMRHCFDFFVGQLKKLEYTGQEYAAFIENVAENLYFTQIIVTDELNAFKVFETLNARGVQLSSADLLKNYLFSVVDASSAHTSRIDSLETKWIALTNNIKAEKLQDFIRYYWNMSHKMIRSNIVFKTIRDEIKTEENVFRFINDMIRYSEVYMALLDKNDELWSDPEIKELVGLLALFRLRQPMSVLMTAQMNLDEEEFKKVLKTIVMVCFRYNVICDKNPNDQELPFNKLAIYIGANHRADLNILKEIYIDDNTFKNSFMDKTFVYTSSNAKKIRYILGKIEKFKGGVPSVDETTDDATIEHILPRDYNENWDIDPDVANRMVDKLGNCCLLERSKNRDLQNIEYAGKKEVYSSSIYLTTRQIASDYDEWHEDNVNKRQRIMANAAVSIWKAQL